MISRLRRLVRAHCAAGRRLAVEGLAGLNGVRMAAPEGAFYAFIGVEGLTDSLDLALRLVRQEASGFCTP